MHATDDCLRSVRLAPSIRSGAVRKAVPVAACVSTFVALLLTSATISLAQDPGWPRQRVDSGNTLISYQPQVDDWKNFQELDWRMAFALTPKGGEQAIGIAVMKGDTAIDNDKKMVLITNLTIVETRFPSLWLPIVRPRWIAC